MAVGLVGSLPALRAQNLPHLGYIYPAGGRQGTSFQAIVGGQFLINATDGYVSGTGVQVTASDYSRPLNGQQLTELRERLLELQKKGKDAATLKEMAEIRSRISSSMRRNSNRVLAETVTLQITVAPDAEPGERELRLATQAGLSNPVVFCVGQLTEYSEPKAAPDLDPARAGMPLQIALPATINGRIIPRISSLRPAQQFTPGDVDRYSFHAERGQSLVIAVRARALIPYLADAVPGWFQAILALYDPTGKEVAFNDDYRSGPDPVLHYMVPREGDYVIEIRDAMYRGRDDFVYRISAGELPFIASIFPIGGRTGTPVRVGVHGWNLPADSVTLQPRREAGLRLVSMSRGGFVSNTVPFVDESLPDTLEKEPNDAEKKAQRIRLPIVVNGRIDRAGDQDVFRFDARAGDRIVAEVLGHRLDSPLDSLIRLTDARGQQLALNDDFEDEGPGLETHHADSLITVVLPAKGAYYLFLTDAQGKGGGEFSYRLRISPPRPDFELRVSPSSISASAGGITVPVTAHVLRKDGFAGEITMQLRDAPRGFALKGAVIPAGQDRVTFTMTNPPMPARESRSLCFEGHSLIDGKAVVKKAVAADDMMQAFAYHHLVPARELRMAVARRGAFRAQVMSGEPLELSRGISVSVQVRIPLPSSARFSRIEFELSDPPEGVSVVSSKPGAGGMMEILFRCDPEKAKPGTRGNLILRVVAERAGDSPVARSRIPLGVIPAIPYEIR